MSEEEEDIDDEPTEVDDEVAKKVITKKVVKTGMKTDENVLECSLKGVKVKMSSNTPHKRVYYKKNYCLYCEKPFGKVTRHLMRKHQDEVDIAKALAHKQGSTMCSFLLSKIRNKGKYIHNCSVKSARQGQMVPKRQTTYLLSATDFLPCYFCLAMYIRTDLWRHQRRCKLRPDGPVKRKVQTYCSFLLPMDHPVSDGLKKILEDMTYDAVTRRVKSNQLILSLGERMFLKNGEVGCHRADMRNKMRELTRLVLVARDLDKDTVFLKDLITPAKFNTVLAAVKKMTGFDHLTNRFAVPSTALKLRHSPMKV
ncbi:uncharacterized protein LOC127535707 isoform X2 [Acanthochromis polyacanthus]|nr:uncharacterized protein LOC127535707 isoform X2 [Acanthochromis polyacanthus]